MSSGPSRRAVEAEIEAGKLLAGKYLIERVIGRGGMGVVVVAVHQRLQERVAIKVLSSVSDDGIGRFEREAHIAARIRSEHVARVMDLGELESGVPYIVMEYLEGDDLAALLKRNGRLEVEEAVDFILQTCVALADAHALGVVHRDLKPANLFCTRRSDGRRVIKVLDFGISKLTAEKAVPLAGAPVTLTATTLGTPMYMSPEQMRSAKMVDARTDIWSLGVILFELLAGEPPFSGESFGHIAVKVVSDPLPALASYRSDLPRGLEWVVRRCLEKDRERRFANVAELAHALKSFAPKRGAELVARIARILGADASTEGAAAAPSVDSSEQTQDRENITRVRVPGTMAPWAAPEPGASRTKNRRFFLAASALGFVAALSIGAAQLLRGNESPGPTVTAHSATPAAPAKEVSSPSQPPSQLPPPSSTSLAPASSNDDAARSPPRLSSGDQGHAPPVTRAKLPVRRQQASPQPAPTSSAKAVDIGSNPLDCSPPYTVDEQGRKRFKRQCY